MGGVRGGDEVVALVAVAAAVGAGIGGVGVAAPVVVVLDAEVAECHALAVVHDVGANRAVAVGARAQAVELGRLERGQVARVVGGLRQCAAAAGPPAQAVEVHQVGVVHAAAGTMSGGRDRETGELADLGVVRHGAGGQNWDDLSGARTPGVGGGRVAVAGADARATGGVGETCVVSESRARGTVRADPPAGLVGVRDVGGKRDAGRWR